MEFDTTHIDDLLSTATLEKAFFSGKIVRSFPSVRRIFSSHSLPPPPHSPLPTSSKCRKWAVLTTIHPPSEAVRRLLYRSDWCLVVVGDQEANPYLFPTFKDTNDNIVFLDKEDQERMRSDFVDYLPWSSFGRKNVGYLYAVARGAEVIWDFDDDNMLKFWIEGASPDPLLDLDSAVTSIFDSSAIHVATPKSLKQDSGFTAFNPYPHLGCPHRLCWPRGFPVTEVMSQSKQDMSLLMTTEDFPTSSIAILQSLADHEPDVDSIFRMTQGTPLTFNRPSKSDHPLPIMLPHHLMSPLNAQATLHFRSSFLALYLPVTVSGRVSDIWRSYIAQAVFRLLGLQVGFLPRPLVVHERNPHSLAADFDAEIPLFTQTVALLEYLELWTDEITRRNDEMSTEEVVEDLWIGLYERKFLEIKDVFIVQLWLQALNSVGYKMPSLSRNVTSRKKHLTVRDTFMNLDIGRSGKKLYYNDTPANCKQLRARKKFWSSDLHDGTRLDLSTQLASLDQEVVLGGIKRHYYRHQRRKETRGKISSYRGALSPVLQNYTDHSSRISQDDIRSNYDFFKGVEEVEATDAFVCAFPASMCQLWVPFNKSVVFLPAHRYNLGRCFPEEFRLLNSQVEEMDKSDRHVVGAMSRYDLEYLKYYVDVPKARMISSLSGFYSSGEEVYNVTRKEILLVEAFNTFAFFRKFNETLVDNHVFPLAGIYGHYELRYLVRHPAIVYVPYSVMSYKLTEFYSLGIPLFMPSAKYFRSVAGGIGLDRTSSSPAFCPSEARVNEEMRKRPDSSQPYSPNVDFSEDPEAEMYWLQFSDFYDWPFIEYFDDVDDLVEKIKGANLTRMHLGMRKAYEMRRYLTLERWCEVIPLLG